MAYRTKLTPKQEAWMDIGVGILTLFCSVVFGFLLGIVSAISIISNDSEKASLLVKIIAGILFGGFFIGAGVGGLDAGIPAIKEGIKNLRRIKERQNLRK